MSGTKQSKHELWPDFLATHQINETSVSLLATDGNCAIAMPYGKNRRLVLKRSSDMDALMRRLGRELIAEYEANSVVHDGILYLMFRREAGHIIPLYFGKAEIYGKKGKNLFVNISDLATGDGKFGRWGYNYAYHIGDLSAVALPDHPDTKKTRKYDDWRRAIFVEDAEQPLIKGDIRFWACRWGVERQSIWREYGSTRLAFEEYLLIGVASDLFPNDLLNREGRNRQEVS